MQTMSENNNTCAEQGRSRPNHWQIKKLGEVCQNVEKVKRKEKNPNEELIYLDIGGIDNNTNKILSYKRYTWQDAPSRAQQIVFIDDILFSTVRTYMKNIAFVDNKLFDRQIASSGFCVIRGNKKEVNPQYIFYYTLSQEFIQPLNELQTGSSYPAVRDKDVLSQPIPIPPLSEQQLIVSRIEELLSDLENGKKQLQIAQQQLKVYRRALIMEGVTGKLTSKWRSENPNKETTDEIFNKIQKQLDKSIKKASEDAVLNGKRKPKDQRKNKRTSNVETELPELPESWNYFRLEDITYLVTDGTHFTPKYQESGVKFLSVKNVRPFYFREEHVKYISEEEHKSLIDRCNPQKGDILYTKVGATYGYAAKVTMDYEFSIFVSLCLIKPVKEYFSSDFLEILMNSELVFNQARKRVSGSGVPDLHLIEIRDFKIPLPSLEEQQLIVDELESKLTVCDKLEETINDALLKSETLRQSILKKAFNGELIKNRVNP